MQWFTKIHHLNELNARVDVNCLRKDRQMDKQMDVQKTEYLHKTLL